MVKTSTPYSQGTAVAAGTGGTCELSFRPGQPRHFFFGRGPFFRNAPGPARPAASRRVCITRRRFFQEQIPFLLTRILPSNLPISSRKRVFTQKVRYPLSKCPVFLVKFPGICRILKKSPELLKIQQNPRYFTEKTERSDRG